MDALESAARAFAIERHGEQKYGDQPYAVHLEAVRDRLVEFGRDGTLLAAAWLHDVLEDTPTAAKELDDLWTLANAAATLKLADRIANVEASLNDPSRLKMYRREWFPLFAGLSAYGYGDPRMWARLESLLTGKVTP